MYITNTHNAFRQNTSTQGTKTSMQYLINPKKKIYSRTKKKKSLEFYSSAFKILFFFFFTVEIILKSFADFEIQKKQLRRSEMFIISFIFLKDLQLKKIFVCCSRLVLLSQIVNLFLKFFILSFFMDYSVVNGGFFLLKMLINKREKDEMQWISHIYF